MYLTENDQDKDKGGHKNMPRGTAVSKSEAEEDTLIV
jgi:hypothetical protein